MGCRVQARRAWGTASLRCDGKRCDSVQELWGKKKEPSVISFISHLIRGTGPGPFFSNRAALGQLPRTPW